MDTNVQETSIQALESIRPELNKRRRLVLNALRTLEKANNKMISVHLGLGVNQVTGRINELRNELKMVQFSHEAICPYTGKNTMWWKLTTHGLEESEELGNPKTAHLIIRPFQVIDGLDKTTYTAQIKSSTKEKYYNVEIESRWDKEAKQNYFKKRCECEGFLYRSDCSHCTRLMEELNKWNET